MNPELKNKIENGFRSQDSAKPAFLTHLRIRIAKIRMIDFTNGNNNRFNPDVYIKTNSSTILAIIKTIESIATCFGLLGLAAGILGVSAAVNHFTDSVNEILLNYLPNISFQLPGFLLKLHYLIPALVLLLIILDGFGIFLMRFADRGEELVRFVHFIFWMLSILGIIIFVGSVIMYHIEMNRLNDAFSSSSSLAALSGVMGFFIYPIIVINFLILLFICNYHHDICVVLKTVHEEKRTGYNAAVGNNHLMGRSGWLAWSSGAVFVVSAVYLIIPLVTGKQLVPEESRNSLIKLAPVVLLAINFLISLLIFLKYLSLRICVGNFVKNHDQVQKRKSSSCFVIILIIIVCAAAYFIGKNNGIRLPANRNSSQTTIVTRTPTKVPATKQNLSTATPSDIRSSLPTPTASPAPARSTSAFGGVDPDLKAFLDEYEKFMDRYVAFMKSYAANPTDLNLLTQYYSMLADLAEFEETADRYDAKQSEMSAADVAYYLETLTRINNKLMSVY